MERYRTDVAVMHCSVLIIVATQVSDGAGEPFLVAVQVTYIQHHRLHSYTCSDTDTVVLF